MGSVLGVGKRSIVEYNHICQIGLEIEIKQEGFYKLLQTFQYLYFSSY